jgi:predicted ATPase with chaperone activity
MTQSVKTATQLQQEFIPPYPMTIADTGLKEGFLEELIMKDLFLVNFALGREIAARIHLPFKIVEEILDYLKRQLLVEVRTSGGLADYEYTPTEKGRDRARTFFDHNSYVGACPVPWNRYVDSLKFQTIRRELVTPRDLEVAFSDIMVNRRTINAVGPAINSGRGMFLFGEAGNGKTSIAERIARSFKGNIFIPYAVEIDGQIIRVFDSHNHEPVSAANYPRDYDNRWVRIQRPCVVVGGELTIDMLELQFDFGTKLYEAPIQLKANCGLLLIDDFGRQRIDHKSLLNRWIVPLEKRVDYLTLHTGKKLEVPFEQLIVFSTNLEPSDLVDEAFLRRIPYKIHIANPTENEYKWIFLQYCQRTGMPYNEEAVNYLIESQYKSGKRMMRCCHPRDIVDQIINLCTFLQTEPRLSREYLDYACNVYFAAMGEISSVI